MFSNWLVFLCIIFGGVEFKGKIIGYNQQITTFYQVEYGNVD